MDSNTAKYLNSQEGQFELTNACELKYVPCEFRSNNCESKSQGGLLELTRELFEFTGSSGFKSGARGCKFFKLLEFLNSLKHTYSCMVGIHEDNVKTNPT